MALPFFYIASAAAKGEIITLDEETSKHVVSVLRMRVTEQLNLTDGTGNLLLAEIINDHKKKCEVRILESTSVKREGKQVIMAVSLLKNSSRFEWFLEKATEIGITEIIPLLCERTERQHFRYDRMKGILISAMLQSQQAWLPELREPVKFADLSMSRFADSQKLIAYCDEGNKQSINSQVSKSEKSLILIGPEGDFTTAEIELALNNGFIPVTLGETRLRTETAAVVAAALLRIT